jgi:nitrogenase-stabilizing/protective protein
MPTLAELRTLSDAEEYFEFFALPWDPAVLRVYRLHVLRRFALEMDLVDRQHPGLGEEERLGRYREALARAHQVFARGDARKHRAFLPGEREPLVTLGRPGS